MSFLDEEEIYMAKEECVRLGECTATYYLVNFIDEIEKSRPRISELEQQLCESIAIALQRGKQIDELERQLALAKNERNQHDSAHKVQAAKTLELSTQLEAVMTERDRLREQVAQLSAPVSKEEWDATLCRSFDAWKMANNLILRRVARFVISKKGRVNPPPPDPNEMQ